MTGGLRGCRSETYRWHIKGVLTHFVLVRIESGKFKTLWQGNAALDVRWVCNSATSLLSVCTTYSAWTRCCLFFIKGQYQSLIRWNSSNAVPLFLCLYVSKMRFSEWVLLLLGARREPFKTPNSHYVLKQCYAPPSGRRFVRGSQCNSQNSFTKNNIAKKHQLKYGLMDKSCSNGCNKNWTQIK